MTPATDSGAATGKLTFVHPDLRAANDTLRALITETGELREKTERLEENLATMYSENTRIESVLDTVRDIVEGRAEQPAYMLHQGEGEWQLTLLRAFLEGRAIVRLR